MHAAANVCAEGEEFAVDAMQGRLEKVALARVLAVKQRQEVEDKLLVDVRLGHRHLRHNKRAEEGGGGGKESREKGEKKERERRWGSG